MSASTLETEIHDHLHQLPVEQQTQVLKFVRALVAMRVQGVPGHSLLSFAGTIDESNLAIMTQAIAEGCEQIHGADW